MKHNLKSIAAALLAVFITGSFLPVRANAVSNLNIEEVSDWSQISSLIESNWDDSYYGEITIDPDSDSSEKDGEDVSLQSEFGMSKKEANKLYQSAEYAETYFSDSEEYSAYTDDEGIVHITSPYQTCRLYLYANNLQEDYNASTILHLEEYNEYILQFDTEDATEDAYKALCGIYGSDQCFLDQVRSSGLLLDDVSQLSESNNQQYLSWGISYMGLDTLKETAQNYIFANDSPVIAVIDTGISYSSKLFSNRKVSGYNFTSSDVNDIYDEYDHGTIVAGIIAESTPENVEIMVLRVFNAFGSTTDLIMNTALQYANTQNVDVVNMSFGAGRPNNEIYTEYTASIQGLYNKGIVPVCAGGNTGGAVDYPASMAETIAVSWISKSEKVDYHSSYGPEIDFAAPGVDIMCIGNTGRIETSEGSSFASPHIAAAAVMIKMVHPEYSVSQVKAELQKYAYDLGASGKDNYYGYGSVKINSYFQNNAKYKLKDIPAGAWYADAVNYVYDNNIMNGVGKGLFLPSSAMSRSMVVQVLYNLAGNPSVSAAQQFKDVKSGQWYYNAIQWAATEGFIVGTGNGYFRPDQSITREDFVLMLYQCSKYSELSENLDFSDFCDVDDWAVGAMVWAVHNNIINGVVSANGTQMLLPRDIATRAQAATIFMKYQNLG